MDDVTWSRFSNGLGNAIREKGCDHTMRHTRALLEVLGFADEEIEAAVVDLAGRGGHCDCEVLYNVVEKEKPRAAESIVDQMMNPERLQQRCACEQAYRKGIAHAFNLAGDLVPAGATADDLDVLTDLAADWQYHARPNVHVPEDLITLWRQGERGITGLDLHALIAEGASET